MAIPYLAARALRGAATRRQASSSVASVASGYAPSLRPTLACVSRPESTICSEGDR